MRNGWRWGVAVLAMVVGGAAMGHVGGRAAGQPGAWRPAEGPLMTRWAAEVSPERVLPEYPRPQLVRDRWRNLNGLWEWAPAVEGEAPPIGRPLERRILVPFPVESALSGVGERHERLWYRRTFLVPQAWREGDRVLLHFGAVDWEAVVYVNGQRVGEHRGGYDPFTFDITEALEPRGEQELVVGVWDPTDAGEQPRGKQVTEPGGIFYTPTTGIWQTVWIEPVAATHIAGLRIIPDVDGSRVLVAADVAGSDEGAAVRVEVLDGERPLASAEGRPGEAVALALADPVLWMPDRPHLYDLRLTLRAGEREVDRVSSYFGMRKIEVGPDESGVTRILLNGEPVFQVGLLDQGFWPDGLYTAPTDAALRHDVEQTKRLGFNMIRKHVKVEPARWYCWCDRLGVLVWQDMPSAGPYIGPRDPDLTKSPEVAAQFERELRAMIDGLRNHPSIIMWVVFNEGWGQHDTARYVARVKAWDPTRLVSNASGWTDRGVGDIVDVHVYPGPGAPRPEAARAAVLGEFGGLGLPVEGHTWEQRAWGYQGVASAGALTDRYVSMMRRVWELREREGLSAAVYTQTTDVETECNGLMTYDRAVLKPEAEAVARANRGVFPVARTIAPTAPEGRVEWAYTFERPAEGWAQPGFDDSAWARGPAGFGTEGTPGATVGTVWSTPEVWIRREFEIVGEVPEDLRLNVHHDEDVVVYINGVVAAQAAGYTTSYEWMRLSPEGRAALRPGRNVIAAYCRQTRGGQYLDVGLVRLAAPSE